MSVFTFVLVVTDGTTLRTVHPAGLGPERAQAVAAVIRAHLADGAPAAAPARPAESFLTQREIAATQGFTGDSCRHCGAFAMRRAGTCLTCQSCGSTTGCS